MPKKARRRGKILGFWANVIKPPPLFLADLKQGGGFFTGIGLIYLKKLFFKGLAKSEIGQTF